MEVLRGWFDVMISTSIISGVMGGFLAALMYASMAGHDAYDKAIASGKGRAISYLMSAPPSLAYFSVIGLGPGVGVATIWSVLYFFGVA